MDVHVDNYQEDRGTRKGCKSKRDSTCQTIRGAQTGSNSPKFDTYYQDPDG